MRRFLVVLFALISTMVSAGEYGTHTITAGTSSVGYRLTTVGSDYRPSNVDVLARDEDATITFYRVRYGVVQKTIPNTSVYSTSDGSFPLAAGVPRSFSFTSSVDSAYVIRSSSTAVDLTWW